MEEYEVTQYKQFCIKIITIFSTIYAIYNQKYMLLPNYLCGGAGTLIILYIRIEEYRRRKGALR